MRKVSDLLKSLASLGLCASLGVVSSCGNSQTMTPPEEMMMVTPPMQEPKQPEMGFNHDGTLTLDIDPFKDGLNVSKEESERTHSCGKITYRTLGTILALARSRTARTHFDHYLHIAPSAPDADAIRRLLQNP